MFGPAQYAVAENYINHQEPGVEGGTQASLP